ncbi:MAG: ArsR/SmtB family transcription factor [Desulfovibrionaceae bacterium]
MQHLSETLQALADPTRLRILSLLAGGECGVGELYTALELPQSTVSRHLAVLRALGWVLARKTGVRTRYRLGHEPMQAALLAVLRPALDARPETGRDREALKRVLKEQGTAPHPQKPAV